jgi:transketolase
MRANEVLKAKGVNVRHLHVSTIKPFTDPQVLEDIKTSKSGVITVENHLVDGGLGTAVSEIMSQYGVGKRLIKLGVQDTYVHGASKNYLMKKVGIDGMGVVSAVEDMIDKSLDINESMLSEARIEPVFSSSKAEAL